MKNYLPLVSICIPTFNGSKFILEALNSASSQTYNNIEIVVSDDASKDDTLARVKAFEQTASMPIYMHHHAPKGIGANWNNCIKNAKGKYIKFLFQDDVLLPNCIAEMVQIMEANPKFAMVASKREFIIETDICNAKTKAWIEKFRDLQRGLDFKTVNNVQVINNTLFKAEQFLKPPINNKIGEPSVVLFKKDIVNKIGYYREDLKQILDYEFCYRLLKKENIAIINQCLVKFRLHQNQATNVNRLSVTDDYIKYDKILLQEYFWYLNTNTKIRLLKKEYKWINFLFKLKSKLKLNGK